MKITGRWEPVQPPVDKRVYEGRCPDIKCRAIFDFYRNEVVYVKPEPVEHKGEFGKTYLTYPRSYYGVRCPACKEYVNLGEDERNILQHLKKTRQRDKALDKYDDEHYIDYD